MCCSGLIASLVIYARLLTWRFRRAGILRSHENPGLTYPHEIKHCVVHSPHLLFASIPCKIIAYSRLLLPRPGHRELTPKFPIAGLEFLPPNGIDARELRTLAGLVRSEA